MIETIISFVIGMFGTYTVLDLINRKNNMVLVKRSKAMNPLLDEN